MGHLHSYLTIHYKPQAHLRQVETIACLSVYISYSNLCHKSYHLTSPGLSVLIGQSLHPFHLFNPSAQSRTLGNVWYMNKDS